MTKKPPTKTQMNTLRWIALIFAGALFVADYGFAVLAKEVPNEVYFVLLAIAIGVDINQLREIAVATLTAWANNGKKD